MKERKDVGAYTKQWNKELKAELKQCVKAYEMKVKEYKKLYEENKRLQNNRDKAIEYIENENNEKYGNPTIEFSLDIRKQKLLDILKGDSDNEQR